MKRRKIMLNLLKKFVKEEEGATMVEYGLMVALIALVAAVGARLLGASIGSLFSDSAGTLDGIVQP
jgi:pilus assembly protein Flp/PilA